MKDSSENTAKTTNTAFRTARRRVETAFAAPVGSDDACVVVPTSGSTGEPRRVKISATALRASGEATAARLGGHGAWLLALPTTHVAGLQVVARSVLAGTEPVVLDLSAGFRGAGFAEAAERLPAGRRLTSLVPTQVHRLLAEARAGSPAGLEALAGFDAVLLGGAATPPTVRAALRDAGVQVVTTYGMSETAGGCVYDGRPLDGVRVRTVDGRVELSGPVLADGYVDDPVATAAAFVTGDAGSRWFRTSDLGEVAADGTLTVLGRADDVVITGGVNVAPAAVEAALAGLDEVGEACVVGLPDPEWGQVVVAVVTVAPGAAYVSEDTLLAQARAVVTDALALRGPGKVDRRAVALLAARRLGRPTSTSER